jgi:hypothetical protein
MQFEAVQQLDWWPPGMHSPPSCPSGHRLAATCCGLQMRCYDVNQLSMKFDRHLDSEIVDFQILSEDYSKAVFLCADRRWVLDTQEPTAAAQAAGQASAVWLLVLPAAGELCKLPLRRSLKNSGPAPWCCRRCRRSIVRPADARL